MCARRDALARWWDDVYWSLYFVALDGPLGRYLLPVGEGGLRRYVSQKNRHPHIAFIRGVKQFSMLHEELLLLLHHLAAISRGGVLEIGAYVGGASVTMAQALALHHRSPLLSIEPGGRRKHDQIPSEDIFGDLQRNLARFGLDSHARLLQGLSSSLSIQAEVRDVHGPGTVTLLVIDADGNVERDVGLYAELLRDGAFLVLDDYESAGAPDKSVPVKKWVHEAIQRGQVESLGVWGWGTWVGRYRRQRP
jgi:predicted O-methyltransferase YrrM